MKPFFASLLKGGSAGVLLAAAGGCSSSETAASPTHDASVPVMPEAAPAPAEHDFPKADVVAAPPDVRLPEAGSPEAALDGRTPADAAPPAPPIGKACTKDADCKGGLTCLKSTDGVNAGGGPPGGYCTKECTPDSADAGALIAAQGVCTAVAPASLCIQLDPTTRKSYCFERCFTGALPPGLGKCGDRLDVGCAPTTVGGIDFCAPTCRNDDDCGGRACDIATGYCVDASPKGAPIGTPCGKGSALEKAGGSCSGFCFAIPRPGSATPLSICSGQCVLGEIGCGTKLSSSGSVIPGPGVCALAYSYSAALDTGYCAQACDCDGDCLEPDTVCAKPPGSALPGQRNGACLPIFFGNPLQGRPCGDAGGDAGREGGARDASGG